MNSVKEKTGQVFSIARDNAPVAGCTISKEVYNGENSITYFSLAKNTDISVEIHPYHKLVIPAEGILEVYGSDGYQKKLNAGDAVVIQTPIFPLERVYPSAACAAPCSCLVRT